MSYRRPISAGLAVFVVAALGFTLTACGGEETPTPIPAALRPKPATAAPLPSDTPPPTDTPVPTDTPNPATLEARQAQLPAGDEVVVQFARIENVPWEPEILGQMTPNFSLQANGYAVYRFDGGSSADGWYQTIITPTLVQGFVQKLADEVKVIDMAKQAPAPEVRFETNADGSPAGTKAYGVIYVKTAAAEGRLIVTQEEIENPRGPNAARLKTLHEMIQALEFWRRTTEQAVAPEVKQFVAAQLGWWVDPRVPYTPSTALAFGTRARSWLPADVPMIAWPLASDPADAFAADFGTTPAELTVPAEDVPAFIRLVRAQPHGYWGPLWRTADGQRFLVGVRPAIPGANNVVIDDYTYVVPKRSIQAPEDRAAEPAATAGTPQP